MADYLHKDGCTVKVENDIRVAKKLVVAKQYDAVFILIDSPDCYGMDFIRWMQEKVLGIKCVGILLHRDTPLHNEVYRLSGNNCFYFHSIARDMLAQDLDKIFNQDGKMRWYERRSPAFQDCAKRILQEANLHENLLIFGESGTGKCSIARLIHFHAEWHNEKFVVADCGSFLDLAEARDRIVGTPVVDKDKIAQNQQSLLAQSNGGTLLVDHVEKLPLEIQEIFVSVLDAGQYYDQRTKRYMPYRGRIIFSSSMNLVEMTMDGQFSERLYHFMSANVMRVPTLTECKADIIPLAESFIREICTNRGIPMLSLTKEAKTKLQTHIYTGNVRELYGVVSGACTSTHGNTIGANDLLFLTPVDSKYRHSREYTLKKNLRATHGNITLAAKKLGVDRTTVTRWMKDFGLKKEDFK